MVYLPFCLIAEGVFISYGSKIQSGFSELPRSKLRGMRIRRPFRTFEKFCLMTVLEEHFKLLQVRLFLDNFSTQKAT